MTLDGRLLRGTVDCVVETAPGFLTVLEFKSGRPRPEHQAQLEIYQQAMRQVFPGTSIDARLIYGDAGPAHVINSH
jgi:ATP-dependent exoDNAse (exonuclease V) beta subunit